MSTIIKRDRFDTRTFDTLTRQIGELDDTVKLSPDFAADIFSSVFRSEPTLEEGADAPHKAVIEQMMELKEWKEFRETTRLQPMPSALATIELADKLKDKLDVEPETRRRVLRRALREAKGAVQEQMDALAAFGQGTGPGEPEANAAGVLDLHKRIRKSPLLRDIAKLAGRMRRMALQKHKDRVKHGPDEVQDIELGKDLARVLPSELVALLDETTEMDFYRRFSEGGLLQYRLSGMEPKGKGLVILCMDSSASMQAGEPYSREVWAKALAMGLMAICAKENRDFLLLTFGSSEELRCFRFPPKPSTEKILEALEFSYHGGTDFNRVLMFAGCEADQATWKKADIIFLTDGVATVSPATEEYVNEVKRVAQTKLYVITLGTRADSLNRVADGVARVDDLSKDAAALELAFSVG